MKKIWAGVFRHKTFLGCCLRQSWTHKLGPEWCERQTESSLSSSQAWWRGFPSHTISDWWTQAALRTTKFRLSRNECDDVWGMSAVSAGSGSGTDSISATYLPFFLLATESWEPLVFLTPAYHCVVTVQVDTDQR